MRIKQINEQISEINAPKEQKDAVLALIDLKTENEMEKALTRFEAAINGLKADMHAKFSAIDSKFTAIDSAMDSKFTAIDSAIDSKFAAIDSAMDSKFAAMDSKFTAIDSKFAAIDNKFTSQFNLLKWIIGGIGAFIACLGILITILKFIG